MKVTIEIDGKPSEVAALAREIAGRRESRGSSVGDINYVVNNSVSDLFETLVERADV